MELAFYKYQGAGNDFIMIDNRLNTFPENNTKLVAQLCNRRFGIGADGLILLNNDAESDFRMIYYNSDGNLSSMCGNGGRCIVAFAKKLTLFESKTIFNATDGLHHAAIQDDGIVSLQMIDVSEIKKESEYCFLNTGSPHHVQIVSNLANYDVKKNGSSIRYGDLYGKEGANVNFVEKIDNTTFSLRTYERGVEDETLACGTGATAVAIAMNATGQTDLNTIDLNVLGGKLTISFDCLDGKYTNVFLNGPALFVFKGVIEI